MRATEFCSKVSDNYHCTGSEADKDKDGVLDSGRVLHMDVIAAATSGR